MRYRQLLCVLAFGFTILVLLIGQILAEVFISGTRLRWTYERFR